MSSGKESRPPRWNDLNSSRSGRAEVNARHLLRSLIGLIARVCALGLSGIAPAASAATEPPVVLLLAGQSNMIGQGRKAELDAARRTWPADVELIVAPAGDEETAPVRATERNTFGPELALAHELAAAWPGRKFKLLKFARGTTSIRVWSPAWTREEAAVAQNADLEPLYPRLLAFVRAHLGPADPAPHAILWFQGERDARFAAAGADYAERLDAFIAALRRDCAAPDAWFILGEVNPPYPDLAPVAEAQRQTPQRTAHAITISAEGLTKRADALHYDTAGQWELGRRFAAALLPTLKRQVPPRP